MANTITKRTVKQRGNRLWLLVSAEFDGTGDETDTSLLDISGLTMEDGTTAPTALRVNEIVANLSGLNYCRIETDRTTDQVVAILPNGLTVLPLGAAGGLTDEGTGGTGDLFLNTDGSYDGSAAVILFELDLVA